MAKVKQTAKNASEFGMKLKELREQAKPKITQQALANHLGLKSIKQVQRYEEGTIPDMGKLLALGALFKYDFIGLLKGSPQNAPITSLEAQQAPKDIYLDKYIASLEFNNKTLAQSIQLTLDTILKLQAKADEHLETVEAGVTQLSTHLDSNSQVVLRSLARLEKKPQNALLDEADRINTEIVLKAGRLGKASVRDR